MPITPEELINPADKIANKVSLDLREQKIASELQQRPTLENKVERVIDRFNNDITPLHSKQTEIFSDISKSYINFINVYDEYNVNYKLKKSSIHEYEKIKRKLESYRQNNNIDNKLSIQHEKEITKLNWIYSIILVIYYSIFVLYLIFSNFIREKKYKNSFLVMILIIYLLIPIILKYILNIIHNFSIFIQEEYNVKTPTLSYEDIIKYEELSNGEFKY
tara:strand:- start:4263 stop:4919 length:657 start_codon:yes stop_codon:yes gene_type:complete